MSLAEVYSENLFTVIPLEDLHARKILSWKYDPPYDFYNPPADSDEDEVVREFLKPVLQFHAVMDKNNTMVGFCSFGIDGQVQGGDYNAEALDIGLGMHPDMTGKGHGKRFFQCILDFAYRKYAPRMIRLTVARFNRRALNLYYKFGFIEESRFLNTNRGEEYIILTLNYKSERHH